MGDIRAIVKFRLVRGTFGNLVAGQEIILDLASPAQEQRARDVYAYGDWIDVETGKPPLTIGQYRTRAERAALSATANQVVQAALEAGSEHDAGRSVEIAIEVLEEAGKIAKKRGRKPNIAAVAVPVSMVEDIVKTDDESPIKNVVNEIVISDSTEDASKKIAATSVTLRDVLSKLSASKLANYVALTVEELTEIATKRGMKVPQRATKQKLITLLKQHDSISV